MAEEPLDVFEQQFSELRDRSWEMRKQGRFRTATRLAQEARRLAKSNARVIHYLRASHGLMVFASGMHDLELCRDTALESIALLESEERARAFGPDFPAEWYEYVVSWMSSCAYDNLAKSVASMCGFNSPGTHECINDGLQICRQTGKMECIACFREYAVDVYLAADDLDMALHYAQTGARRKPADDQDQDRRWAATRAEGRVRLLRGELDLAIEAWQRAMQLAPTFHSPETAATETMQHLETAMLLAGREQELEQLQSEDQLSLRELPAGEWAEHDLANDYLKSLKHTVAGEFDAALQALTVWDQWLTKHQFLSEWFETRLRIVAIERLRGQQQRAEKLAKPLEAKAQDARDWLTLRRLKRLLDPQQEPTPLATAEPLDGGRFAGTPPQPADVSPSTPEAPAAAAEDTAAESPLRAELEACRLDLEEVLQEPAKLREGYERLLAMVPQVEVATDARQLLYLMAAVFWRTGFVDASEEELEEPSAEMLAVGNDWAQRIWTAANSLVNQFEQSADVLNLAADLADSVAQHPLLGEAQVVEQPAIQVLFERSLDLDPDSAVNHARAGAYYWAQGHVGEAERALARGFRLDRTDTFLALRLSEVYSHTERPRDALEVLDMCLREGNESPRILWEAAMMAYSVRAFDAVLTYLARFDVQQPSEPWSRYYQALAHLDMQQPAAAAQAIADEAKLVGDEQFHIRVVQACAAESQGQEEAFRQYARDALDVALYSVDYLSYSGIASLHLRLWQAVSSLAEEDPLRESLLERLVALTYTPDEYIDGTRRRSEQTEEVRFFRVVLRQPLPQAWRRSNSALQLLENWDAYVVEWGVLAANEDAAEAEVLRWQQRSGLPQPDVLEVDSEYQDIYREAPGAVWQGSMLPYEQEEDE